MVAQDSYAAGEAVATNHPNIVLLNLHMRGVDGFEVCRRIKSNQLACHAAIIAVTDDPSEEAQRTAKDAGAIAYLSKPLDIDLVCRTIEEQLPVS